WQFVQLGSNERPSAVRTSLLLKDVQLEWLNTLKASKRNSTLTFSWTVNCLCREASNFAKADPLAALRSRLPFASLKSTTSPVSKCGITSGQGIGSSGLNLTDPAQAQVVGDPTHEPVACQLP